MAYPINPPLNSSSSSTTLEMPFLSDDYSFPPYSLFATSPHQDLSSSSTEKSSSAVPLLLDNKDILSNENTLQNNSWLPIYNQVDINNLHHSDMALFQDYPVFPTWSHSQLTVATQSSLDCNPQYHYPQHPQTLVLSHTNSPIKLNIIKQEHLQPGLMSPPETPSTTSSPSGLIYELPPSPSSQIQSAPVQPLFQSYQFSPSTPTSPVDETDTSSSCFSANSRTSFSPFPSPSIPTHSIQTSFSEHSTSPTHQLQDNHPPLALSTRLSPAFDHSIPNENLKSCTRVAKTRKPSKSAIRAAAGIGVRCENCGVTVTPLWRRSSNNEPLCNACGLYHKLHAMHRPKHLQQNQTIAPGTSEPTSTLGNFKSETKTTGSPNQQPMLPSQHQRFNASTPEGSLGSSSSDTVMRPTCTNCKTTLTPLWRKDDAGEILCNACGLYYKLHHIHRPISLKRNIIRRRSRYENGKVPGSTLSSAFSAYTAQARVKAQTEALAYRQHHQQHQHYQHHHHQQQLQQQQQHLQMHAQSSTGQDFVQSSNMVYVSNPSHNVMALIPTNSNFHMYSSVTGNQS
ncbi:putative electron transfer flavoprotein subunit [Mortierella sp. AM989]|nr:putative electron transfer flavoprotein subunit [Mortierella sp. AM989]